jgi:predicted PurR-regulated permease PerM
MLILAFLMLLEVDRIGKNFYFYVPPSYHARVKALVNEVNGIFGNYMRGNFICVFANGILTYFLLVAGVLVMHLVLPGARESFPFYKYALVASLFAGIMFPIPYVAHGLSMLLGAILAYMQTQSLLYGFFIGFVIFIAFQIVDFIVRPKIMGDALGVSTIFVFFAAISGGEIFGTIGLFMGIPLSLIMISLFRFVYYNFLTLPRADSSQPGTPCPVPPADGEALAGES